MKNRVVILFFSIFSSCTVVNLHNFHNENRYHKKVLDNPELALVKFEPIFVEDYDLDAKFFYDYFEDTTKFYQLQDMFVKDLENKNILSSPRDYHSIVSIDTIFLTEDTHWEMVTYMDGGEEVYVGEGVAYDVFIAIKGHVEELATGKKTLLKDAYSFTSNPKPGVMRKDVIVHSNNLIDMDIIFSKLFNKLSYGAYKSFDMKKKSRLKKRD